MKMEFNKIKLYLSHISLILMLIGNVRTDNDWTSKCKPCECKWNSGLKYADCRNTTTINKIPTTMDSEMQVLDLSYNLIPEIRRNEFNEASLENLHKIFMKHCTLEEIHSESLFGLNIVIELDFSNNRLTKLHSDTFNGLIKLRTLLLNNNLIEKLDDHLFSNLTYLRKIELKNNRLITIGLRTFVNVNRLWEITLDSNQLTYLNKESFEDIQQLRSLSLLENPWNCTCGLQQFQKFINNGKLSPQTKCTEPKHLQNQLWTDIPSENFACTPIIINPMKNLTTISINSQNVSLTCHIRSSPKPTISWQLNRKVLSQNYDKRIQISNSHDLNYDDSSNFYISKLNIIGVRINDKGVYTCMASNSAGAAEIDYILTIPTNGIITKSDGTIIGVGNVIGTSGGVLLNDPTDASTAATLNVYLIIFIIIIILLVILIIILLVVCCYCKRKRYSNKENGNLILNKMDKSLQQHHHNHNQHHHQMQLNGSSINGNDSMLEGSVIMEMQKSLLTEVNPVEKPPRRADLNSSSDLVDDGHELKKTLLDESQFGHDDETRSLALSDTTPRSRATYVDDGYGTNLPPDLIAFPSTRGFPQSPSLQSSMSNIHPPASVDGRQPTFIKSPMNSPIYAGNNPIFIPNNGNGIPHSGFRTLQHPKIGRNILIGNNGTNRSNSPFTPAPIVYTPIVMKQGYVTIPRKPRASSNAGWTLSQPNTIDYAPISPTSTLSSDIVEPVYDNLGLRTTAGGNSILSLNKIGTNPSNNSNSISSTNSSNNSNTNKNNNNNNNSIKYSMKDRPLPATPRIYEAIEENGGTGTGVTNGNVGDINGVNVNLDISGSPSKIGGQSLDNTNNQLYNHENDLNISNNSNRSSTILLNGNSDKIMKIPPRPPPKPKKKKIINDQNQSINGVNGGGDDVNGDSSTSQLFQDEGEDGTEV